MQRMGARAKGFLAGGCAVALLVATPRVAGAQPEPPRESASPEAKRAEAIERFDRGVELYKEGNYTAALSEFRAAHALSPSYRVLYNIGQVSYQLQDYVTALQSFEAYLAEGAAEIPEARRAEVEGLAEKLRGRVSTLEVQTSVPDAEVSIDDVPVGKSPLPAPVKVNAGRHRVTASRSGFAPATRAVDLPGAARVAVHLELAPLSAPVATGAAPARAPAEASRMTTLSWIGVGVAGACAAAAVGTGVAAIGAKNDLDAALPSDPSANDARSRVQTLSVATDVLIGAAVVTLGATLVLTFLRPKDAPAAAARASPPGAAQWTF